MPNAAPTVSAKTAPEIASAAGAEFPIEDAPSSQTTRTATELQRSIAPIGRSLAASVPDSKIRFEFGSLRNTRPQVCHTPDGYISVSSGILERLNGREELAAVLALEMAELLVEQQQTPPDVPWLPSAGPGDDERELALAAKLQRQQQPITTANVQSLAGQILASAGFREVDVLAVQQNIQRWTAEEEAESVAFESIELFGN